MTGTSPAKSVSAGRHITGSTVLTVDLGNSRHKLLCLSICVMDMSPNGKRAGTERIHRKCTINAHMEGPAKGCCCLPSWLERSETGSSHQNCTKSLAAFICPRLCPPLASPTSQHAMLSSMGKQRLQNWLVSLRSDLCLRGLCSLKMTPG